MESNSYTVLLLLFISVTRMNLCFQIKSIAGFLLILDFQQAGTKAQPRRAVQGPDCTAIFAANASLPSGVYRIKPKHYHKSFEVFCEKRYDGGWTIIQRRNGQGVYGGPEDFRRWMSEYEKGFGHVDFEHWLGLVYIHALTHQPDKKCELRVDMRNCKGKKGYAVYKTFEIGNEDEKYRLSLGKYRGNVGDAFRGREPSENQDGNFFSAVDSDNDDCGPCFVGDEAFDSCAGELYGSGWWFSNCGMADLNGMWHPKDSCRGWVSGVYWKTWSNIDSLLFSELKIKCA
ncbi:angiopoietin-related protein 5-like [Podarcis muralis]